MKSVCKGCGHTFEGHGEKFCNDICRDSHIEKLETMMRDAVRNDPNHTLKLSRDF